METRKNLLQVVGDWLAARQTSAPTASRQPGRAGAILRWFLPNGGTLLLVALLIATQSLWARPAAAPNAPGPSATTVNYQGRLADSSGAPIDGTRGMTFALWDALTGGNLIWGPESHTAVPVSDGLFSVGLGSQTSGGIPTSVWNGDRYLEITVGGETLAPRELLRSVPIAGMALTVPDGAITQAKAPLLLQAPGNNYRIDIGHFWFNMGPIGWREQRINFSQTFSSPPEVYITLNGASGSVEVDNWERAGVYAIDTTGFTLRAYSRADCYGVTFNWLAVGQ